MVLPKSEDVTNNIGPLKHPGIVFPGTARTFAPEGTPLLPNLGKASAHAYWLDLTVSGTHIACIKLLIASVIDEIHV